MAESCMIGVYDSIDQIIFALWRRLEFRHFCIPVQMFRNWKYHITLHTLRKRATKLPKTLVRISVETHSLSDCMPLFICEIVWGISFNTLFHITLQKVVTRIYIWLSYDDTFLRSWRAHGNCFTRLSSRKHFEDTEVRHSCVGGPGSFVLTAMSYPRTRVTILSRTRLC